MEGYDYMIKEKDKERNPKVIIKDSEIIGLIPRSLRELYRLIEVYKTKHKCHVNVFCSFLQIYNEKVYDLLNVQSGQLNASGLRIRWNKEEQFKVENLFVFECKSPEESINLYNYGVRNKVMASHNLNISSSRSHTLFTITIQNINQENIVSKEGGEFFYVVFF
jgi:hypothetical protein